MPDCTDRNPEEDELLKEERELERFGLNFELTRRKFMGAAGALTAGIAVGLPGFAFAETPDVTEIQAVSLKVNGTVQTLSLDPRTSLLDALREHLDLTGTKKGCDHGQCGACTVLIDGRRVNSCLTLALAASGAEITTIEGLARTEDPKDISQLHPVQAAFLEHDGYQCGYCTPGQICSAVAAVEEQQRGELSIVSFHAGNTTHPEMTDDEIRERMSGNICRCGRLSQHRRSRASRIERSIGMNTFSYERATSTDGAIRVGSSRGSRFLAGGTNLIDLMKYRVEAPTALIDVNHLDLSQVSAADKGGVRIGALVRNSDLGEPPSDSRRLPSTFASIAERRFASVAQHGDHRGQSPTENALLLLHGRQLSCL